MIIKELIIDDNDERSGIRAVSLVDEPAIEENFLFFNKDVKIELARTTPGGVPIRDFFEYTAQPEPETIETSHDFCIEHAAKVYHISEINAWGGLKQSYEYDGMIQESDYFTNFHGNIGSYNVNKQIYNCRHWLRRVNSLDEIPSHKLNKTYSTYYGLKKEKKEPVEFEFEISSKEKREIEGLALQSGQFIYRKDIQGEGEGYIYFSRDTIRKVQQKYGFNRSITIQHQSDITGTCILLDSWLVEDDENNKTQWFLKYKVIDDKLWEIIKNQIVKGFSIEGMFDFKN